MSTLDERNPLRAIVSEERTALGSRFESLRRGFVSIVEAADTANVDDEHDPEGTTIAFDRAQILSMIESAQLQLAALDLADSKIEMDTIDICESYGGEITPERLWALPTANRCVACAAAGATHR